MTQKAAPLPWFKCFQDAYLDGTRDLTPEQRGLYFDCLCLIYKYDQPLRNDDDWIAHQLHVKLRKWKAVRRVLINAGKLTETDAGLINSRASRECVERVSMRSRKSVAAASREENKRVEPEFPFENNKGGPQLCLVKPVQEPQQGPHARARSDHQSQKEEDRSFESGDLDGRQSRPSRTLLTVSDDALDRVRKIAPGWDRQALLKRWQAWSDDVRDPDAAFLSWVRNFTKGQAAS